METSLIVSFFKGILMPVITIFFLNHFNLFEYIKFIPEDFTFEVGLAGYLGILECVCYKLNKKIESGRANIECVFSSVGQHNSIDNTPEITFCNDVAFISGNIKVSGKISKLCKNALLISFPNWVDIQVHNNSGIIVANNTCKIDLNKMVNKNAKKVENATFAFKISIIKNYIEDVEYSITIQPTLKKMFRYNFKYNKFTIN